MVVPQFATLRLYIDNKSIEFKTSNPFTFFKTDLNEIWRLFYEKCGYTEDTTRKNRLNPRRRKALRKRTGIPTCIEKKQQQKQKIQVDEQPRVALESSYTAPVQRIFSFFKRETVPCKSPEQKSNVMSAEQVSQKENIAENTVGSIINNFKKLRKKPDISKGYVTFGRFDKFLTDNVNDIGIRKILKNKFSEFGVRVFGDLNFHKDDVNLLIQLIKQNNIK